MRKPSQVAAVLTTLVVVFGRGSSAAKMLAPIPALVGGSRAGAAAMYGSGKAGG